MKRIWEGIKIVLCVCAVMGWWGVLYPELVLTTDTCRIFDDSGSEGQEIQKGQECPAGQDIYWDLLKAEKGDIRFRSRLFTEWNKFMEALNESDQNKAAP